jgi:hypothetical protein
MANRIIAAVARALRDDSDYDRTHFHADATGRPYVCDNARCESPGLDPREL